MRSWKPRRVELHSSSDFNRILNSFLRAGNGSLFLHCKATLLISVKIINQYILFNTIQQGVKCENSQHFVSSNVWTVGTAIHQIAIATYFTNFWHILCYSMCSIMNWGNHSHIIGIQSSKCRLYWSHPLPVITYFAQRLNHSALPRCNQNLLISIGVILLQPNIWCLVTYRIILQFA